MSEEVSARDSEQGSYQQKFPGLSSETLESYTRKIKATGLIGKFDECLRLCRKATSLGFEKNEFIQMEAEFLVLTNQLDEANHILERILKENPRDANAIYVLGMIFYYRGNLKKSVEVFNDALEIDSSMNHIEKMKEKANRLIKVFDESE